MTTTINNEHNKLNVPNLRFKEFLGEWEKCKLGELTTKVGKHRLLWADQWRKAYRATHLPQLLSWTYEASRHASAEIPRTAPQLCHTLHWKQLRLQDCKCIARTCQYHNNPQPLCSPKHGTEEKVHWQDVQISWKIGRKSSIDYKGKRMRWFHITPSSVLFTCFPKLCLHSIGSITISSALRPCRKFFLLGALEFVHSHTHFCR